MAQIKGARPNLIFLSETKVDDDCVEYVKCFLNFDNKIVVESNGSLGGLCMMWKNDIHIKEVDFNNNLIAIKVFDSALDWLLVGFYGPLYYTKKKDAWGNLFALLEAHQGSYACIGDFNFIINDDEQFGSKRGSSSTTNYLKELLFEFNAVDLGFSGNKFTWAKGRWGSATIKRRLDRGVANISWRLAYPKATITHLGAIKSDHTPSSSIPIRRKASPIGHFVLKPSG